MICESIACCCRQPVGRFQSNYERQSDLITFNGAIPFSWLCPFSFLAFLQFYIVFIVLSIKIEKHLQCWQTFPCINIKFEDNWKTNKNLNSFSPDHLRDLHICVHPAMHVDDFRPFQQFMIQTNCVYVPHIHWLGAHLRLLWKSMAVPSVEKKVCLRRGTIGINISFSISMSSTLKYSHKVPRCVADMEYQIRCAVCVKAYLAKEMAIGTQCMRYECDAIHRANMYGKWSQRSLGEVCELRATNQIVRTVIGLIRRENIQLNRTKDVVKIINYTMTWRKPRIR